MKAPIIIVVAAIAILAVGTALYTSGHSPAPAPTLGSTAGPIDSTYYHCWAGVCEYFGSSALKTASTTPCAIQGPAATSTVSAVLRVDTSSTTATVWTIGSGTTAYATTTAFGTNFSATASSQVFDVASTSGAAAAVVPPNGYVVFSETGGITAGDAAGTGFVPAGRCRAIFTVMDQ